MSLKVRSSIPSQAAPRRRSSRSPRILDHHSEMIEAIEVIHARQPPKLRAAVSGSAVVLTCCRCKRGAELRGARSSTGLHQSFSTKIGSALPLSLRGLGHFFEPLLRLSKTAFPGVTVYGSGDDGARPLTFETAFNLSYSY